MSSRSAAVLAEMLRRVTGVATSLWGDTGEGPSLRTSRAAETSLPDCGIHTQGGLLFPDNWEVGHTHCFSLLLLLLLAGTATLT